MRQVAFDDALVGLASAVMLQAVEDFQKLQRRGVINADGEIVFHRFGDRIGKSSSYKHVDGFRHSSEAAELCEFLKGWGLELLCDLPGYHACRIRRKLGLSHNQGRKAQ